MTTEETPVEEPASSSRAAGGCVLMVLVSVAGAVVFTVSTEAGILSVFGAATAAVWWAVRRVPHAANPAPPPLPEVVEDEKPQVRIMQDPSNPARHIVVRDTEKETR
ncbi:hypothetical protein [Streptomyces sp. NPDC002122]|uniref:hypothetical protein n=1 Tax=Streptomyces sp. NPDC002122 TaxID=3154407 RepID=UPI00331D78B2